MRTIEVTDATASLEQYAASLARDEALILTRDGQPIAALTAIAPEDVGTARLTANGRFWELIERSRREYADQGGISTTEMRRRLGLGG